MGLFVFMLACAIISKFKGENMNWIYNKSKSIETFEKFIIAIIWYMSWQYMQRAYICICLVAWILMIVCVPYKRKCAKCAISWLYGADDGYRVKHKYDGGNYINEQFPALLLYRGNIAALCAWLFIYIYIYMSREVNPMQI